MEKREAYKAIILFGFVSLIGDIIYEGARGVTPSYLGYLGASAFIVGATFGLGEFISFALRLVSGIIADKTRAYWALYLIGYFLIISIPLLGLVYSWWLVIVLILTERFAKSFRSPARDTLLSVISREVGAGKTFGLHELLDQIGAVMGPASLGLILLWTNDNYTLAFNTLFIPYILLVFIAIYTYGKIKDKTEIYMKNQVKIDIRTIMSQLPTNFKLYIVAVTFNTLGLIHWSLILVKANLIQAAWVVSFLYVLIQLVDAAAAPISGYIYDKIGRILLFIPFLISIVPTILTLVGGWVNLIIAGIIYGWVYGMQESVYRAGVTDLVPLSSRGSAYGIFNAFYGIGLFLSGTVFGLIINLNAILLGMVYGIIIQVVAILILLKSLELF